MKYYFLGIKGSGMSALAMILHAQGHQISGADTPEYIFTQAKLDSAKVVIDNIDEISLVDCEILVVGNSFKNSETLNNLKFTKSVKIIDYVELVREQSKLYESYAIAGSHGKTTTTGLLVAAFKDEPISYLIGDGNGGSTTKPTKFIFEACEYKGHFLKYKPNYAIITNIDFDHPDYFTSIDSVISEFINFSSNVKHLFINIDDVNVQKAKFKSPKITTFGLSSNADYYASNICSKKTGISYDLNYHNLVVKVELPFYGEHMIYNSLAVFAVGIEKGQDVSKLINNLKEFKGVNRRFTLHYINEQLIIIDDYAHHPLEIEKTIAAARQKYPSYQVIAIHQPHTFSRTTALLNEFAASFKAADKTYLLPIWGSVRENSNTQSIKIEDLISLTNNGESFVLNKVIEDTKQIKTVILLMSAANIQYLIQDIKNAINN
jgi:UDP-N-acetylmuramate--alanine ligase